MSDPTATRAAHTIPDLIRHRAAHAPDRDTVLAPERPALDSAALWRVVRAVAAQYHALGIGRGHTVALVLADPPTLATAFLATSACAACAPLNPAYGEREFRFYLEDLRARALVVDPSLHSPAEQVARELGVEVLYVEPHESAAGSFALRRADGETPASTEPAVLANETDVALVLHTSGTTARPKVVQLSHANLCASARHIGATLRLEPADRCLNVMPLFHIHGLVAAVLASLAAGGSVVCAPGMRVPDFFEWLATYGATWYTAVPTMHQAALAHVEREPHAAAGHALRFIRSSSAALPPAVLHRLERAFGVPVVEAYGMTEAAHQMASNPLPPAARKPGSVGRAAGPDVAVMNEAGTLLGVGETGEVVIRGPNVTRGYRGNAEANARAFTDGWFRTGDQGYLDAEGYLFLTGRLKELINRGGEKVSPLEVDAALMEHPAVAQAVAFALPHDTLGEEVAAAVVLREGASTDEATLRRFVSESLAYFKIPRRIVFVDALPKGATGKLQRIGLAERLGVHAQATSDAPAEGRDAVAPRTPLEEVLAAVWMEVLGTPPGGVHADFFAAGGDSLRATSFLGRVQELLAVPVPPLTFYDAPTVAALAGWLAPVLEEPASTGHVGFTR